jgi:hypothetical protein
MNTHRPVVSPPNAALSSELCNVPSKLNTCMLDRVSVHPKSGCGRGQQRVVKNKPLLLLLPLGRLLLLHTGVVCCSGDHPRNRSSSSYLSVQHHKTKQHAPQTQAMLAD